MYRFNYFTEKANHVINLAITSAEELGHNRSEERRVKAVCRPKMWKSSSRRISA